MAQRFHRKQDEETTYWLSYSDMMAGLLLSVLPVLIFYLIGQKYIIEGVIAGSVKG